MIVEQGGKVIACSTLSGARRDGEIKKKEKRRGEPRRRKKNASDYDHIFNSISNILIGKKILHHSLKKISKSHLPTPTLYTYIYIYIYI